MSSASDSQPAANSLTPFPVQLSGDDELEQRQLAILDALAAGTPYREIAATHRISIASLSKIAQRMAELDKGAVAKLMQSKALRMLEHWERAAETGAESGKHAAAKEWLTHSKALEPVSTESSQGAKVAIMIGMPGQPAGPDPTQVLTVQAVTGTVND